MSAKMTVAETLGALDAMEAKIFDIEGRKEMLSCF